MFFCDSEFCACALVRQTIPIYNCSILTYIEHYIEDRHALTIEIEIKYIIYLKKGGINTKTKNWGANWNKP